MRVYRIEREKYLATTLTGTGAAMSDGYRWNSLNTYLVYTAESRSLAMLEVSVHLDISEDLPNDRHYVEIDIPEDLLVMELLLEDMPEDWDAKPPRMETQFIGDDFIRQQPAAVLKVPSAIIPQESNYLINPAHPDARKIKIISAQWLVFDERLRKQQ